MEYIINNELSNYQCGAEDFGDNYELYNVHWEREKNYG